MRVDKPALKPKHGHCGISKSNCLSCQHSDEELRMEEETRSQDQLWRDVQAQLNLCMASMFVTIRVCVRAWSQTLTSVRRNSGCRRSYRTMSCEQIRLEFHRVLLACGKASLPSATNRDQQQGSVQVTGGNSLYEQCNELLSLWDFTCKVVIVRRPLPSRWPGAILMSIKYLRSV